MPVQHITCTEFYKDKHSSTYARCFQGTYSGATFSCLMKNSTFPTNATALFRPSDRRFTVALLYDEFTYRKQRKSVYCHQKKKKIGKKKKIMGRVTQVHKWSQATIHERVR